MLKVYNRHHQSAANKGEQIYHPIWRCTARYLLIFIMLGIASLSSCSSDTDKDGISDEKDKCPTEFAKTKEGCPVEEKIKTVRFFIDRSGSMNGYYKGETEFVNNIGDLLAKVESIRPIKEIWMVGDGAEKFKGNASDFTDQILRTQPKGEKSSMMDDIFGRIAAKTDSNDISIFISDGILSFSDQDIKKNRDINKENASGLQSNIYRIFNNINGKKGFGTSIYAFKSVFNGTYYNYQNGKVKLVGEERPYYIWIIGRKNLLSTFNNELLDFSTFHPLEQLHFGLDESAATKAKFIPTAERMGDWNINDEGTGINNLGKGPSKFCIALNLSSLPAYVQEIGYLKTHILLDFKGCDASLEVKDKKDIDQSKLRGNRQKEDFESATHIFIITVKQMKTSTASVHIMLPVVPDNWYMQWNCSNDLNIKETCSGKTFALQYLVNGIIQAYEEKNKAYINISIPLKQ